MYAELERVAQLPKVVTISEVGLDYLPDSPDHAVQDLALNLLNQERSAKVGIKAKRKKAGWNFDYLMKVLSQ